MPGICRTAMINSNKGQLNSDYDFSMLRKWALGHKGGLMKKSDFAFNKETGVLSAGSEIAEAVILCKRPTSYPLANQTFLAQFQFSGEIENLPTAEGTKIFIEVKENLILDPTLIQDLEGRSDFAKGFGIGEIKAAQSWPTHENYLKLYEIQGGEVVDLRKAISISSLDEVASRTTELESSMEEVGKKIEKIEQKAGNDSIVISGEFGERIYNRNISESTQRESGTQNSSYFQFTGGSIMGLEIQMPTFPGFFRGANLSFSWNYGDSIYLSSINIYDSKEKTTLLHTFNIGTLTSSTKIPLPKLQSGEKYFIELHSIGGSNHVRLNRVNQNTFKLYNNGTLQSFSLYTKIEVVSHPYDNIPKIVPVCLSYINDGERELGKFYMANPEHDKVIGFCATSSSGGFTNKMIDSRTSSIEIYGEHMAGVQFTTLGTTSKIKLHGKRLGSVGEFRLRVFGIDSNESINKSNMIFTKNFNLDMFGVEADVVELDANIDTQEGVKYAFVIDFPAGNETTKLILSGVKPGIMFSKNENVPIGANISTSTPIRIPINSSVDFLAKVSFNARTNNSGMYCNANVYQGGELIASIRQGMPYAQEVELSINNIPVKGNRGDCFLVVYWNENSPSIKNIKMTIINGPTIFYQSDSGDVGLGTVGGGALYFSAICRKETPQEKVVNKGLLDVEGINIKLGSVFYDLNGVQQVSGTLVGTKIQATKMLVEENVKFGNKNIFQKSANLTPNQSLGFTIPKEGQYKYVARVNTSSHTAVVYINGVKAANIHSSTPKEGIVDLRRGDTIFIISNENTNTVNVSLDISDEKF